MTKAQLEEELKKLRQQRDEEREAHKEEVRILKVSHNNTISDIQDKMYEMWKQNNGKFMKRYIEELISDGDLSFSFNSSYGGYFQMEVSMDGKVLTTVDGEICMSRNGLDE